MVKKHINLFNIVFSYIIEIEKKNKRIKVQPLTKILYTNVQPLKRIKSSTIECENIKENDKYNLIKSASI